MTDDDGATPDRSGDQHPRWRQRKDGGHHRPASYAPAVTRLRRGLPALPAERRRRARVGGDTWRGVLLDIER